MTASEFNDKINQLCGEAMEDLNRREVMQVMAYATFSLFLAHSVHNFLKHPEAVKEVLKMAGTKVEVVESETDFMERLRKHRDQ